jgi:hypothetical protein
MKGWSATTMAWGLIAAGALFCGAGSAMTKEETAAFEAQVWGRAPCEPGSLDLDNFTRYQAKLRLVAHF